MKYLPIKFHLLYILGTLLFSFFGPREYYDYNKVIVFLFVCCYLVASLLGFYIGFNFKTKYWQLKSILKPHKLFKYALIFLATMYMYNVVHLYINNKLSFSLSTIGTNYLDFYEQYGEKKGASIFTYEILFLVTTAIPKFIVLGFGFYHFKRLSRRYKVLFVSSIFMIILSHTIAMGNQKSIGDIVIFSLIAFILFASKLSKIRRKKIFRKVVVIMFAFLLFLSYSQYSRFGKATGVSVEKFNNFMNTYSYYNPDHVVFTVLGDAAGLGLSHFLTGYLSNGYYGLSLCLEMPFKWTYGLGSSVALSTISEKALGVKIYEDTYLYRMEILHGVPGKKNWHTIFPWLASDFTFLGAIFIMFLISIIYGKAWKEVLFYENQVSLLMFSLLTIMFIFIPANNQIFHGFDYLSVSIFIFIYWLIYHNKYNPQLQNKATD